MLIATHQNLAMSSISKISSCQNWQYQLPQLANVGCQNWQMLSVAKIGKCRWLPKLANVVSCQNWLILKTHKLPKLEYEYTWWREDTRTCHVRLALQAHESTQLLPRWECDRSWGCWIALHELEDRSWGFQLPTGKQSGYVYVRSPTAYAEIVEEMTDVSYLQCEVKCVETYTSTCMHINTHAHMYRQYICTHKCTHVHTHRHVHSCTHTNQRTLTGHCSPLVVLLLYQCNSYEFSVITFLCKTTGGTLAIFMYYWMN